jgi:hypothetical protein
MARNTRITDATSKLPTEEQAAAYDRFVPMLEAAHHEMTELSKKKQDGIVNALKIKMINRLLTELTKVIKGDPSYGFVDMLDEEAIPQNSDAVLVLSQWRAALKQYKSKYHGYDGSTYRWFTAEKPGKHESQ